ncbi:unnamed protein product [Onchocerca flexuosa]|nr:unnamed protein product [Onchocerca flexuosa]
MSHGCSTLILPSSRIRSNGCFHSNVLLKTTPPHPLQTQYCFCTGDTCNLISSASTMMRIGGSRLKEQDSALITRSHASITNITSCSTAKNVHISVTFLLLFVLMRCYIHVPISSFALHRNLSQEGNWQT